MHACLVCVCVCLCVCGCVCVGHAQGGDAGQSMYVYNNTHTHIRTTFSRRRPWTSSTAPSSSRSAAREGGRDESVSATGREGLEGQGGRDGHAIPTFCPARSRFVHQDHTVHYCLFPPLLLKRGLHSQICVELLETLAVWLATTNRLARCSDTQFRRQTGLCPRSRR